MLISRYVVTTIADQLLDLAITMIFSGWCCVGFGVGMVYTCRTRLFEGCAGGRQYGAYQDSIDLDEANWVRLMSDGGMVLASSALAAAAADKPLCLTGRRYSISAQGQRNCNV